MTDRTPASTSSTFTGEHPVYQPQEAVRTYETTETSPNDTPHTAPARVDFVVLNTPTSLEYIQKTVDVTAEALRRAIAALNEELRERV